MPPSVQLLIFINTLVEMLCVLGRSVEEPE